MDDDASHLDRSGAPDWDAIARYLSAESPAEETLQVARWLDAHPGDRALIERLNETAFLGSPAVVDVEAALRSVRGRINNGPRLLRGGERRSRAVIFGAMLAAAAGIAAFAVIWRSSSPVIPSPDTTVVYATNVGARDSVRLPDGSRVILGPNSSLTVRPDFGKKARTVELRGTGYFDVVHLGSRPFVVRTSDAIIEDVGTTFSVEGYHDDTTSVSVMSGIVRLRSASAPRAAGATLSAGDRGVVTRVGTVRAQPHSVVADDSAWTTGKLIFKDASLARVARELRQWYGLRLGIADSSLLRNTVTATFTDEQPADQVLRILSLVLGGNVERRGDTATIHRAVGRIQ